MNKVLICAAVLAGALVFSPPDGVHAADPTKAQEAPTIMWPSPVRCLFAAWLYGGPDPAEYSYLPVRIEPRACIFTAYIREQALILEQRRLRVEIPMPDKVGWQRVHYFWGSSHALIEQRQTPVRLGPLAEY